MKNATAVPLAFRVYDAVPLSPIWIGLGVLALLIAATALIFALLGLSIPGRLLEFELAQLATIAYAPTAAVLSLRGAQRGLRVLAPVLDCSPEQLAAEVEGLARSGRVGLGLSRLGGILVGIGFALLPEGWEGGRPPFGDPLLTWVVLRSAIIGWGIGVLGYLEFSHALRYSALGARWARVDLLDLSALRPFGQQGVRSVGVWLGLSILFSLLFLAPWGRLAATVFSIAFAVLAGVALWLPARGVHARIVAARDAELERLKTFLARERAANLSSEAPVDARLSNLLAYRTLVQDTSTWPFDVSTWLRFVVYVLLGLGSWLGGAVVERLLGDVLGS